MSLLPNFNSGPNCKYRISQKYKLFTLRVQRHEGPGGTRLVGAHWTMASRVSVSDRTEEMLGAVDSTNRSFCGGQREEGGRGSSKRKEGVAPPPCVSSAVPFYSGSLH